LLVCLVLQKKFDIDQKLSIQSNQSMFWRIVLILLVTAFLARWNIPPLPLSVATTRSLISVGIENHRRENPHLYNNR